MNGVTVPGPVPSRPQTGVPAIVAPPSGATVIDFDDAPASCSFSFSGGRLTTQYAAQGVTFGGVGPNGGVVLDECGNFGVTGHSSPNFLAFNILAVGTLPGGGTPAGPETITFAQPAGIVQMNVGDDESGIIQLQCNSAGGVLTKSVTGTSALQTLTVQGVAITDCTLTFTSTVLVVDDLAFLAYAPPIPTTTELGLLALLAAIAVAGALRMRVF